MENAAAGVANGGSGAGRGMRTGKGRKAGVERIQEIKRGMGWEETRRSGGAGRKIWKVTHPRIMCTYALHAFPWNSVPICLSPLRLDFSSSSPSPQPMWSSPSTIPCGPPRNPEMLA